MATRRAPKPAGTGGVDYLYRLLDNIQRRQVSLRTATVTSFTATRCTVTIAGGSVTNVPMLAAYTPTNGDTVMVLQTPSQLLILGKVK